MEILLYIAAGAGVGFLVGLTGVGGGSLMTPLLILFGFPPSVAVGTDLIYASVTKSGGVLFHHRQGTIDWGLVRRLAVGSIPASLLTIASLSWWFEGSKSYEHILTSSLGVMLMVTAAVLLLKGYLKRHQQRHEHDSAQITKHKGIATVLMGIMLGICVTLSSVGAGAFGAASLTVMFPTLAAVRIIGTDLAHAVPLTLVGGLGHLFLGNVDFALLSSLLIGSLPAIYLGSRMGRQLPERVMQPILATLLMGIGLKYAFL